ncbi:hypothetical protein Q5P01_005760 [Channa striata]|uniref:Insulin-like growth factor-binding protein 5 n=1 Tax=Channa striata TaxID=64152 RepID=A0AA88NPW2_CHASR|nr:hypothetical protein Q5P01_005760 [Channa striata]
MLPSVPFLVLPLLSVLTGGGSSYVPCEPCDQKALSMCPPVPASCQPVKEPGCGCCLTCALEEGRACGVYTGPCARGLRCLPKDGEEKPLHALLHGRGMCANEKLYKQMYPSKDESHGNGRLPIPDSMLPQTKVALYGRDYISSQKALAMEQAKHRQNQRAKSGPATKKEFLPPIPKNLDIGPCRRRLDNLLQGMKDTSQVMALSLYLPNCDKKGFFKRKQCKPSRGRKRGICWCVDRFGMRIPGVNYAAGDLQCKDVNNSTNSNE